MLDKGGDICDVQKKNIGKLDFVNNSIALTK